MMASSGILYRFWCIPFAALLSLLCLSGCSGEKVQAKKPGAEVVPVTLGAVVQKAMPVEVRTIGTVQAYHTVSIRTQVSGELIKVNFDEGQDVTQGQPLFEIDPRPFEQAVRQAE